MNGRKANIKIDLDDYRMLKMLSLESSESIEKVIHSLLKIVHERVEFAYEQNKVPPNMDGYSLMIYKGLHLKNMGCLTSQAFFAIIENKKYHYMINEIFEADLEKRHIKLDTFKKMLN